MLPAPHRLTRGDDLRRVSRQGTRRASGTLVVHVLVGGDDRAPNGLPARVGFAVGRGVGSSVVRHRVLRRLRHLCRELLASLPPGSEVFVRALPPAGHATYQELRHDLDRCLQRALGDVCGPGPGTVS